MTRIVFMGTPDFAVPVLEKLIETQQVVGVVTQPDRPAGRGKKLRPSPIKVVAEAAGIEVFQPKSLRKPERATKLVEWQPDAIIVAAFGQILRPHVLDLPPLGCINVHASLLPRWRGAAPIQRAIEAGDTTSGVCLMKMDVGLDTGPVYSCLSTEIALTETAQSLHDKLAALGADLIERDLPKVLTGEIEPTAQPLDGITYAHMISKDDGAIDWSNSAETIDRKIRAMTPWPSTFTHFAGKQLKILSAQPAAIQPNEEMMAGQVFGDKNGIFVVTGDGALRLEQIQLQGKRRTDVAAFVNGRPHFIGAILGEADA